MSDPLRMERPRTTARGEELGDVLASIRRLIAQDARPGADAAQAGDGPAGEPVSATAPAGGANHPSAPATRPLRLEGALPQAAPLSSPPPAPLHAGEWPGDGRGLPLGHMPPGDAPVSHPAPVADEQPPQPPLSPARTAELTASLAEAVEAAAARMAETARRVEETRDARARAPFRLRPDALIPAALLPPDADSQLRPAPRHPANDHGEVTLNAGREGFGAWPGAEDDAAIAGEPEATTQAVQDAQGVALAADDSSAAAAVGHGNATAGGWTQAAADHTHAPAIGDLGRHTPLGASVPPGASLADDLPLPPATDSDALGHPVAAAAWPPAPVAGSDASPAPPECRECPSGLPQPPDRAPDASPADLDAKHTAATEQIMNPLPIRTLLREAIREELRGEIGHQLDADLRRMVREEIAAVLAEAFAQTA